MILLLQIAVTGLIVNSLGCMDMGGYYLLAAIALLIDFLLRD